MFKKKKKTDKQETRDEPIEQAAGDSPGSDAGGASAALEEDREAAVDTLAGLLRVLGELSFDTPEVDRAQARAAFDGWARHALVGAAPPGTEQWDATGPREWAEMRRFFTDYRRMESEYVARSLDDLRETVWFFIQGIGRALPEERASDTAVGEQLERLRGTIDTSDTAVIRQQAVATIELVEHAIEERLERSSRRNEMLASRVEQFANELIAVRRQLERDGLTKVYNRAALDEFLEKMIHLADLSGHVSTLYMIDVDDFKWVNDKFGHQIGDEVLKEVSKCLSETFMRRGDFVARYGGDEFSVIAKSEDDEVDEQLGETVVQRVRDLEVPHGDEVVRVTLSVGAAKLLPGEDAATWMGRADAALYAAKEGGRDRLVLASELPSEREPRTGA